MTGSKISMLSFMEGANKKYIIPVYQRKYDWKNENCRQLYDDLVKIINDKRNSHFFGSIVTSVVGIGGGIEYHIIDGQQRLTTITLILLAIKNLIEKGIIHSNKKNLNEEINQHFLIDHGSEENIKIKLMPVKSDREALIKLFGDEEDYDQSSHLTINYKYFYDRLSKEELQIDEIFAALKKLEIICITLDNGDNAQLIFESLNSTGLALTEGDKIRNYILMGLSPYEQDKYYDNYWKKIEECTNFDVSDFVRDYLSIKQQMIPTISTVYTAFKNYTISKQIPLKTLLEQLKTKMV